MPGGVGNATRVTQLWPTERTPAGVTVPRGERAGHRPCWRAVALLAACCWTASGLAAQIDYGVGLTASYATNINRVETGAKPEITESIIAGLNASENTGDVNGHVLAQVERRHFVRGTFSDDTTAFIDGAGLWTITPRRFTWLLENTFREVQLDLTAPDTPSNRAKSNSLNTGPNITFPLSSTNSILVGGRYGRFDIQNSDSDNRRYGILVSGIHSLSPQSRISANYEAVRTYFEPEATPFPKVLREDEYFRFDRLYAGTGATVDLGSSRITRYGGSPLVGNIVRISLIKATGPDSAFRVLYADEISDTFTDLIRGVTQGSSPTDPGVVVLQGTSFATADLYHSQRAELAYGSQGARFQYTLLGYGRRVDFQTLDEDYDERGGRFTLNWILSGATRVGLLGDYTKREYQSFFRQDIDRNTYLTGEFRLNRNMSVTLFGNIARRDSTADGQSYVDKKIMVVLGYSTGSGFAVQTRR